MSTRIAVTLALFVTVLLPSCGNDPRPADAMVVVDAAGGDASSCGGAIPYLQTCVMDNDCSTCLCRSFGHSVVCTIACLVPTDCPAPSSGCSGGFCRP